LFCLGFAVLSGLVRFANKKTASLLSNQQARLTWFKLDHSFQPDAPASE
jgi:hypothetical protein